MKKLNRKVFEIIFLFILSLAPLLWLSKNQLILGHDSGFRLDPVNHLHNLFYSWNSISNFGVDWSFFKGFLITQLPETLFTAITHSLWMGEEITFIFWFFLMGISMYVLINDIFPKKDLWIFRILSSLLYMYNFFILQGWFIAERAKFSLYAALPLGFLIIFNTFERKYSLVKGTALFSLLFFLLNGGGNPPLYGGLLLTYFILFIFLSVKHYLFVGTKSILFSVKTGAAFLFGFIFLNSYWILPQAYLALHSYANRLSNAGGVEGILGWEGVISKNASLLNLFRLQGIPDWYDNPLHPYANAFLTNPFLIVVSCLPLLIIIIGLIQFKNKEESKDHQKIITSAFLIFFIGIIFSAGTHPPFGGLYGFLITKVPGFAIFRSSYYKFSPALFFSTSLLVGYFFQNILVTLKKWKKIYVISLSCVLIVFILYNFPFFLSNFFIFNPPFTTRVSLPNYTVKMFSYIKNNVDTSTKILLLPDMDKTITADSYAWGYWSLDLLPRIALNNSIVASDSNVDAVDGLYTAIKANNENTFLQLAKVLGIRKILWRGDMLLNDHVTTSKDLQSEETNLQNFASVHLEKKIGLWNLYAIQLPLENLFLPISTITSFQSDEISSYDITPIITSPDLQRGFIEDSQNQGKIDIANLTNSYIRSAVCTSCDMAGIDTLKNQLVMPSVRLLPWSRLYFLVTYTEERQLQATATLPAQRIDVDLSNANKRLVEIWRMGYKDFSSHTTEYSQANATRYETEINDAILQTQKLTTIQKNDYLARLLAYIEFQKDYIQFFNQTKTIRVPINELMNFMDSKGAGIKNMIWMSLSNIDKKSFIDIQKDGMYSLLIKADVPSPSTVFVDNKKIDDISHITLNRGMHSVEVIFSDPPNREKGIDIDDSIITLTPSTKFFSTIDNFSYNEKYIIHFNYMISPNKKINFGITQNNATNSWDKSLREAYIGKLIADGKEHTFSYVYKPYPGAKNVQFYFLTQQEDSQIALSHFTIQQDINPRIYALREGNAVTGEPPTIKYHKENPTSYTVTVQNAQKPFVLEFNQAFNPGWKATILGVKNISIEESKHVEINGYANGWYIDKIGTYSLKVEYLPQKYFYIGIIGSILALAMGLLVTTRKKK